jgi:hypothetical protein
LILRDSCDVEIRVSESSLKLGSGWLDRGLDVLSGYRSPPPDARYHLMHALPKFNPLHSKMDCIPYNDRIQLAVADLKSQESLNYAQTAKKWNLDRSTLSRRHRGITGSKQDQYSYTAKAFTDEQENVLVRYINDLSARGLSPTSQIVKNLAEELAGKDISQNWVSRFVKRKKDVIKSIYLTSIDYQRKVSDNSYHYKHFFANVRLYFYCVMIIVRLISVTKL